MSDNKTLKIFNDFCSKINQIYSNDSSITQVITNVLELHDEEKMILVKNLYDKFILVPNGQELLNNKKVKLFSSKEEETYALSCSLFGVNLTLKKIFNSLQGQDKNFLWISLGVLIDYSKPIETTKVKNSILNVEVDENVDGMIQDIVKEFKTTMEGGNETNPMQAILGITGKITEKYQDKLQSGEIKLDGLINDLQKNMPGVKEMMDKMMPKQSKKKVKKEKIIIDENFSTNTVPVGLDKPEDNSIDLSKMLPMLNGLGSLGGSGGGLGDIGKMLGGDMGDIFKMVQNPDEMKNADPEKLKEMKNKMDKIMKEQFNINVEDFEKQAFNNKSDL